MSRNHARNEPDVSTPDTSTPDMSSRLDAIEAKLDALRTDLSVTQWMLERDLDATERDLVRRLDDLESAHASHAGHTRHLDRRAESIEAAARAQVEKAREQARADREARARELAGDRVRVRAVREVDAWIGPRGERFRLSPGNVRANVAQIMTRAAWEAMLARSEDVRAALGSGAVLVEDLSP